MNEQLQSKITEILFEIQSATKAAGDFAIEQLPDVVQSYVLYGRVYSVFGVAFSLAIICFGVWLAYVVHKECKKSGDIFDAHPGIVIFGSVGAFFSMLFGSFSIRAEFANAALVWLAPKVWLIKELAGMLK